MFANEYRKMDQADELRKLANKINNFADAIDTNACNNFNKKIKPEHMQQLLEKMDSSFDSETEELERLIIKKQKEDLDIEETRKYKFFEEKYGECLGYNKSFIDRFYENMGE